MQRLLILVMLTLLLPLATVHAACERARELYERMGARARLAEAQALLTTLGRSR